MTGQILSHYRILESLGHGGMGVVYKAHDLKLGRYVAVKFLSEELSRQHVWLERFQREARTASALNHPNICTIHEVDEHEGRLFIVMELLEGHALRDEMAGQPLALERVLDLAIQVATSLQAAHAKQIVHRDLKPANIFITEHGLAKLLDFGLAKLNPDPGWARAATSADDLSSAETLTGSLTDPGLVVGTVPYMSPEQVLGQELDHRTDLFSLGVVLYQMITGRRPFEGATATETILHIARDTPARLDGAAPELERIILKCLEKDREKRYPTADALLLDLKRLQEEPSTGRTGAIARRWRWRLAGAAALVLVLAVMWAGGLFSKLSGGGAPRIESLAVLPLASGDPSQDYFADAMAEALSAELGQIQAIKKVISRTSVMQYKGTKKPLRQIAGELNVDGVVEASVFLSGNQVRITAKLIDAKTDNQVWVQTYKESLVDVLSLQSKVARSIATEIQSKLTQQDKVRLARVRPVNPEAYLAYMKGRYYWDDFKEESLAKAIEQFTEAIRLDPNYAAAHAGLALAWRGVELVGAAPSSETLPKAKEEAQKALALDASLPETHAVMGAVLEAEWNYQDGEVELRRALELNPSYTQAHLFFVTALRHQARHEEAISHAKRALELDPLSFLANENLGDTYVDARQYDRAIEQYQKALDLHPDHSNLHYHLGLAYAYNKMYEKGIAEIQRSVKLDGGDPDLSADLAYIYSVSGRKDEARKILKNLTLFSKEMAVPPESFAVLYSALGETDRAFEWLEKAYQQHSRLMTWLKVDPRFDSLRQDPRFNGLLQRSGLL